MTVIEYIIEADDSSSPLVSQFRDVVDTSFDRKNLKGLKTIKRDLNELIGDLSENQKNELSSLLVLSLNETLDDVNEKAECIISKGYVDNEDDYRFLNGYIDYLLDNDSTDRIGEINRILLQYLGKI